MEKAKAKVTGAHSNVMNIMSICIKALEAEKKTEYVDLIKYDVLHSNTYSESLAVMQEYVEFI